jgi:hypothetical protein
MLYRGVTGDDVKVQQNVAGCGNIVRIRNICVWRPEHVLMEHALSKLWIC